MTLFATEHLAGQDGGERVDRVSARGRLFRKYVALFVAVVSVALLANGLIEIWFSFQEQRTALVRMQSAQAEAAAAKIGEFIREIEGQLGWMTQLPWSARSPEEWRFDAVRLLRQVPAITELARLDGTGHEQARMSRLAVDVIGSQADLSADPKFVQAIANDLRNVAGRLNKSWAGTNARAVVPAAYYAAVDRFGSPVPRATLAMVSRDNPDAVNRVLTNLFAHALTAHTDAGGQGPTSRCRTVAADGNHYLIDSVRFSDVVFAVPGMPVTRQWPPTNKAISICSSTSCWPTIT